MNIVREGRRYLETSTGEITCDLDRLGLKPEDRNLRPSKAEARKKLQDSMFAGRLPVANPLPADYHCGPWPSWCPHTGDTWTCKRCNYGVERADGKKIPVASEAQRRAAEERSDVDWHYFGSTHWFGRDAEGRDYEMDINTGKVERIYSVRDKRDALELIAEYGLSAASRKTSIPRTTLKNWHTRGIA